MANEAVIIELLGNKGEVVRFRCADNLAITKGALLRVEDPRTISGATVTGSTFAGIAAQDKVSGDGMTSIGAYTYGIFDLLMATNSTCQAGDLMVISGTNAIAPASDMEPYIIRGNTVAGVARAIQSGMIIGKALETGSSAEVIAVFVGAN